MKKRPSNAPGKIFLKILNEQLATPSLRQRSQEMLNNIKLNDKSNN